MKCSTMGKRIAVAVLGAAMVIGVGSSPAVAATNHSSALVTNNGCSWDGFHRYTFGFSGIATADTEKKGGNCVEVHVRLFVNGATLQDWDGTKAIATLNGTVNSFGGSDHNADPLGPPPYVGFYLS